MSGDLVSDFEVGKMLQNHRDRNSSLTLLVASSVVADELKPAPGAKPKEETRKIPCIVDRRFYLQLYPFDQRTFSTFTEN